MAAGPADPRRRRSQLTAALGLARQRLFSKSFVSKSVVPGVLISGSTPRDRVSECCAWPTAYLSRSSQPLSLSISVVCEEPLRGRASHQTGTSALPVPHHACPGPRPAPDVCWDGSFATASKASSRHSLSSKPVAPTCRPERSFPQASPLPARPPGSAEPRVARNAEPGRVAPAAPSKSESRIAWKLLRPRGTAKGSGTLCRPQVPARIRIFFFVFVLFRFVFSLPVSLPHRAPASGCSCSLWSVTGKDVGLKRLERSLQERIMLGLAAG